MRELCEIVHAHGGRVYVDGANLNALVGVAAPGEFGGDVSHLNLHKTFCIPHGGGGPGVGPVCVVADLVPFLPSAGDGGNGGREAPVGAVCAAPLGNAGVLPISWMYLRMMGAAGPARRDRDRDPLRQLRRRAPVGPLRSALQRHVRRPRGGGVAHECILDLRPLKEATGGARGISAEDVAKRLIDYGFHAPTLSFPVPGTLMVEPTESESLRRARPLLRRDDRDPRRDRARRARPVAARRQPAEARAAHRRRRCCAPTGRTPTAARRRRYPLAALRRSKYWPPVGRVDNVWGDRNLSCTCPPTSDYASS